jgi:hypothetical protein
LFRSGLKHEEPRFDASRRFWGCGEGKGLSALERPKNIFKNL